MSRATPGAEQVEGHPGGGRCGVGVGPAVRDGEVRWGGFAQAGVDVEAAADGFDSAPTEFVEQRQQPFLPGDLGGRVIGGKFVECFVPFPVGGQHGVPGAGDGGVDRHAGRQLVVGGGLAGHA